MAPPSARSPAALRPSRRAAVRASARIASLAETDYEPEAIQRMFNPRQ